MFLNIANKKWKYIQPLNGAEGIFFLCISEYCAGYWLLLLAELIIITSGHLEPGIKLTAISRSRQRLL